MPLAKRRLAIARRNIEACFPEMTASEHDVILREHFASLGAAIFETGMAWWSSDAKLRNRAEINGLENLESARRAGKGVLLFGGHFTSIEIAGRLLGKVADVDAVYRVSDNPAVEHVLTRGRGRYCERLIARDDVRGLVRRLRGGHTVWYAPDQNTQRKKAVFVDFMGHRAATTPATSRLANMTGARVVPFRMIRKSDGSGYLLELEPPLEDFPTDDLQADTLRINQIVERWVRMAPEQYLWIHRRFKTRPSRDDPPFY